MILRGTRFVIGFSLLSSTLLLSCGQPTDSGTDSSPESLVTKSPGSRWKSSRIPICFMNARDVEATVVQNLRKHTETELARTGVVSLTGWTACSDADLRKEVIRVLFMIPSNPGGSWGGGISQVGRSSQGLGTQQAMYYPMSNLRTWNSGRRDGSGNPIHYVNMGSATLAVYVRKSWPVGNSFGQTSQKGTFLHEIGHALGLFHEQDRTDSRCKISPAPNPNLKQPVGPYDPHSLMNYCAGYNVNNGRLTAGDIAGIRTLF